MGSIRIKMVFIKRSCSLFNLIRLGIKLNVNLVKIIAVQLVIALFFTILMFSFQGYDESYREAQAIRVGIINKDLSKPTLLLLNNFRSTDHFSGLYHMIDIKEEEAEPKMQAEELDAFISIPEGFAMGLYHFENKPVHLNTKAENITKNAILSETLHGFSEYIKAVDMASYVYNDRLAETSVSGDEETQRQIAFNLELLSSTLGREKYYTTAQVSELPALNSFDYFLVALPLSLVSFLSIAGGLRRLREDASNVKQRLELSGLSTFRQALSFYFSQLLALILLLLPLLLFVIYKNGVVMALRLSLALILCYAFFTAIWRLIALFTRNRAFMAVAAIAISFTSSLIAGGIVPYVLLPAWAKYLSVRTFHFGLSKFVFGGDFSFLMMVYLIVFLLLFVIDLVLTDRVRPSQASLS